VKPAAFAYAKARSLDDAIRLLGAHKGEAKLLAGGQSLIATLNMRLSSPSLLIDINGVAGLDGISIRNGMVEIGAMTRHVTLERSSDIAKHAPLIARAMPHIAHPAIRNRGTIGGSLAYADPAAELPACLVALDGEVDIAGPGGKRSVNAGDFFKGLFETALGPHDVLSAVRFRAAATDTRVGFAELARRHGDYAMVGLAAVAKASGKGLSDVRLVYFGVGATPVRARKAEAALANGSIDAAVQALDLDPESDIQATGDVKKHLAVDIRLTVNGETVAETVEPRTTLVDFVRETLGLTGSHVGCEHGVCGACTVLVDGEIVRGCLTLAVQCEGARVETIEGVSDTGTIADLQEAFRRRNALQCGFCTPAMLLTAQELLARGGVPSRDTIREHISGNYCRCTGYQAIVDAIEFVAQSRAQGKTP
jgi:carbon-monoxide dehydrogenase medium subunit